MIYQSRVREEFAALKQINHFDELIARSLRFDRGYLICISELYADDDGMITLLAKWRKEATELYDQFEVTFGGTKKWLRELVLDIPDRILFLVLDKHGRAIGHMGFARAANDEHSMEFDLVVRGVPGVAPGIMSCAAKALFDWANQTIKPLCFYVHTNVPAEQFYTRLGFEFESKTRMRQGEYNIHMKRGAR